MKKTNTIRILATAMITTITGITASYAVVPFSDDFNTDHHYFNNGVAGTGWDQIINPSSLGSGSEAIGGQLVLQAKGNNGWENGNNTGSFLSLQVTGDFSMEVEYVSASGGSFAGGGLMAWSDADDWISVYNHPHFGDYTIIRDTDDGVTFNNGGSGQPNISMDRFIRLDRTGNNFTFFTKENFGDTWTQFAYSTTRSDMSPTLSVGVVAANYDSGNSESLATVRFENYNVVPEPASAILAIAGAGMVALRRRRR